MIATAPRKESRRDVHGHSLTDHYAWLRDPDFPSVRDPEILDYLSAENAHFDGWARKQCALITSLEVELKARIKQDDSSVPVPDGQFEYHWAFRDGDQYRTWYRRKISGEDALQVILDGPAMAEGHEYFSLRSMVLTEKGDRLGYALDTVGDERYNVRVRNLVTDTDFDYEIANTSGAIIWDNEGRYLFYVELNDNLRPFRVCRFDSFSPENDSVQIFEERDPGFFVSIGRTSDRKFLYIYSGDHVSREVLILSLYTPLSSIRYLSQRREGHLCSIDHANDYFYILTNDSHENFRLARTSDADISDANWQDFIVGSDKNYILNIKCFKDFIVVHARLDGQSYIQICDYYGRAHRVDFGMDVYACSLGENREFACNRIRVSMNSPITPSCIFDYDVDVKKLTLRKAQEIPSGFDADHYECRRIWADSDDGARIPITITKRKDVPLDGTAPLLLYGYGAYGHGLEPAFGINRFSLIDRGVIYAMAHVRGGDELGYAWYRDGKLAQKTNTFDDFICCRDKLISEGYAAAERVAIMGASAGGMLVGAVLNKEPESWSAAVAQVPFVDVLNTMLDASLPLTPIEWPEWGDPIRNESDFLRIQSYSPYDNIKSANYPPILVTAGISDPRVTYWEPAKWVAKLREHQPESAEIYLKTNMGAGHFGVTGRFDALTELAQIYAFVLEHLGVVDAAVDNVVAQ